LRIRGITPNLIVVGIKFSPAGAALPLPNP
jgi:hypothetical protein